MNSWETAFTDNDAMMYNRRVFNSDETQQLYNSSENRNVFRTV